ncbi:MAG: M3 family metallopeptidase [Planctomycetota bacterium]|jgi:thimet oligopeptidase
MISPSIAPLVLALSSLPLAVQDTDSLGRSSVRAFAAADAAIEAICAVPEGERTFENTIEAIDDAVADLYAQVGFRAFMEHVHPDARIRDQGAEVGVVLSNWFTDLMLREDLFSAVEDYVASDPEVEGVDRRLLDELVRDFRRAGMELEPEQRERVRAIDRELTDLGRDFSRNIALDGTVCLLTEDEVVGLDEDDLALFERSGDLFVVPMRGPNIRAIFQRCTVPTTRQKVSIQYGRRGGPDNVRVIEEMVALRHERAQLLGYPSTAHYELEVKMAADPEQVEAFYADLAPRVLAKAEADIALYTEAKREATGDPDAVFDAWDRTFYHEYLLRERYAVDPRAVQEHFPLEAVYAGLFDVTSELFGIRYEEVGASDVRRRTLWHPDVQLFDVFDTASGDLLGSFYIDLFPREGKYTHAAQFPIRIRKQHADGKLITPVVALVCNFTKPTDERPSLLTHGEVETFFHEFGHCLHSILSESDLAWFAGTSVARDFVEAPSQMLENWVWDADVLARFARHYETGAPLSGEILEGLVAAKNLGSGHGTSYQVYLGRLDMGLHSDADGLVDVDAIAREAHAASNALPWTEGGLGYASFGHLDGYQAGYYGYLWSLVYAQDMFTPFEGGDLLDPELGARYRRTVLAAGGTRDAIDLVRDFIGREPNSEAFSRHLGLDG